VDCPSLWHKTHERNGGMEFQGRICTTTVGDK
jgi:hypothetical protein